MQRRTWLQKFLFAIALIIWTTGCILLIQFLLALLVRFTISNFPISTSLAQTIYTILTYVIAIPLIIILPSVISRKIKSSKHPGLKDSIKSTRSDLGLTSWPTWTDLGLAPVGFVIYTIIAAIINGIFTAFPWYNATEAQDLGYNQFIFGFDRVLAFFALVIVVPIAEELIFRGFLYIKLKKTFLPRRQSAQRTKNRFEIIAIIAASLITSLIFALMHGQWNVGINVFIMSLTLCAMREITGTIYSGIILHMIKNSIAFVIIFVLGGGF